MNDVGDNSSISEALLAWLFEAAPFGVLVTGEDLSIRFANEWLQRSLGSAAKGLVGRSLFDVFPILLNRGFDRYYNEALAGQSRILSHRFHKYLIPLPTAGKKDGFDHMQQRAQISPFMSGDRVSGTITVIEDVTERVSLEQELNFRITETQRLLASEISARELAEENDRIRGSYEALRAEGTELQELSRARDLLMHRILKAQEEERRRIARDIHDNLGQQLTALRLAVSRLRSHDFESGELAENIELAEKMTKQLDSEVDFLARRVRPTQIDDLGLEEALRAFVMEWSDHVGIPAHFYSYGLKDVRLEPDTEINLYRIAQEALNNISKHAGADRASVLIEHRENGVVLIVEDNGKGFDPSETNDSDKGNGGLGLFGMRERAILIGGTMEIESTREKGTTIYVRIGPFHPSTEQR